MLNKPFYYIEDPFEIPRIVETCKQYKILGLDTETTRRTDLPKGFKWDEELFKPGLDPYLSEVRLIQLATENEIFVIDCWSCKSNIYLLAPIFYNHNITKIGHNLKFDVSILKRQFGFKFRRLFDTMLASQILSNGIKEHMGHHNLRDVVQRYLRLTLDKEQQLSDWSKIRLDKDQIKYAALDVDVLHDLARALFSLAIVRHPVTGKVEVDLRRTFRIEFDCLIAVAQMELNGVYIDSKIWDEEDAKVRAKFYTVAEKIRQAFKKPDLNLESPVQVKKALKEVGIDTDSTKEEVLELIKDEHPVIPMIIEYRGLATLLSRYGNGIPGKKKKKGQYLFKERIHPITGRIHSSFGQVIAETGRFNSKNPNVQNLPAMDKAGFRRAFKGQIIDGVRNSFIVSDYSNCELRILAEVSKDPTLIKAFMSGVDVHTFVASMMFKVPIETIMVKDPVTKKKLEKENYWMRGAAKTISFGLVYGMTATSLSKRLSVSFDEAKDLMKKYFDTYKLIKAYLEKESNFAIERSYSLTKLGRRRFYQFDRNDRRIVGAIRREGSNMGIQGANADVTKIAAYRLHCLFEDYYDDIPMMVNIIHDEFNVEAPAYMDQEIAEAIKFHMEEAEKDVLETVPVQADVVFGEDWSVKS